MLKNKPELFDFLDKDLAPAEIWSSSLPEALYTDMEWLRDMPDNTFFNLYNRVPDNPKDLPIGFEYYVLSWHEPIDIEWLDRQAKRLEGKIICLHNGKYYDNILPDNVKFYRFYDWHKQTDYIRYLFPKSEKRKIKYKFSAINNRITHSKLVVYAAIKEYTSSKECLTKLNNWLEPKNVNYFAATGNATVDKLSKIFYRKYCGKIETVDDFEQSKNVQRYNSNPYDEFLTSCALHFALESYSFSYMSDNLGTYIRPGAEISEKTLKCLVGGTPFLAVGQFDIHTQLQEVGFRFEYNLFDLNFDKDPGNITRLEKTVDLIADLSYYDKEEIYIDTKDSAVYNREHIYSNNFFKLCHEHNLKQGNKILKDL